MGMDVYGKAPTAEVGEYFRRSMWGWRPLADCLTTLFPAETAECTGWQYNDGDGLNAEQTAALVALLETPKGKALVESYVKARDAQIAHLPDEPCKLCNATGIRTDEVGVRMGMPERICDGAQNPEHPRRGARGWCNGCDGEGHVKPTEAMYSLEVQDVEDFRVFMAASGGFEIH